MAGYVPPRLAKKQKKQKKQKQQQLEESRRAAAAQPPSQTSSATALNPATSQIFIPGLTLIQQNSDGSVTDPPPLPSFNPPTGPSSKPESPPRAAPSAASGGVPEPSPQYLAQANLEPRDLAQPRRILIIMDLNGTLLYRPNKRRPFNFVERPHAKAFLSYCLETFYVAIWSSARPENVSKMVDQLLNRSQRERCLVIWARDRFGLSGAEYNTKVQVYKRLTSVWANKRISDSHPLASAGGRWDQTNTVLVDDSLEKARSEPFNILQIPEFSGLDSEQNEVLPQVHDYLNVLSHQSDISRYMRKQPFQLDPSYLLPSS